MNDLENAAFEMNKCKGNWRMLFTEMNSCKGNQKILHSEMNKCKGNQRMLCTEMPSYRKAFWLMFSSHFPNTRIGRLNLNYFTLILSWEFFSGSQQRHSGHCIMSYV